MKKEPTSLQKAIELSKKIKSKREKIQYKTYKLSMW